MGTRIQNYRTGNHQCTTMRACKLLGQTGHPSIRHSSLPNMNSGRHINEWCTMSGLPTVAIVVITRTYLEKEVSSEINNGIRQYPSHTSLTASEGKEVFPRAGTLCDGGG